MSFRQDRDLPPDGGPASPEEEATPAPRRRGLLRELVELGVIVLVVVTVVRLFLQPYAVEGASMEPAFESGDRIFVNRTAYTDVGDHALWDLLPWAERGADDHVYLFGPPARGDIVVIASDQTRTREQYIKRVVGLPGETVSFREGLVLIDGEPLVEDYIPGAITECQTARQFCDVTVPAEHVYVLGDNRTNSEDSRSFGPIPYDDIVGKAIFTNWPADAIGPIRHPDYGEPVAAGDERHRLALWLPGAAERPAP